MSLTQDEFHQLQDYIANSNPGIPLKGGEYNRLYEPIDQEGGTMCTPSFVAPVP